MKRAALAATLLLMSCLSPSLAVPETWVVLVAASRYWFNYRHLSNVLAVYQIVKQYGVSDSNIILMNGFDDVCGTRNPFPGQMFGDTRAQLDICRDVRSDYRGSDVTADAFLRVLTGRHYAGTPLSKRMHSNNESNVVIYLSGHGGDGFFKFRDVEEVSAEEIGSAVAEMELKGRYNRMLFISDTCQAATLARDITSRNVTSLASSGASENSYAYSPNPNLGVSLIDRFSYSLSEFFRLHVRSKSDLKRLRLSDLVGSFDPRFLQSTPSMARTDGTADPRNIRLSTFFGAPTRNSKDIIETYLDGRQYNSCAGVSWPVELEDSSHLAASLPSDDPVPTDSCAVDRKDNNAIQYIEGSILPYIELYGEYVDTALPLCIIYFAFLVTLTFLCS